MNVHVKNSKSNVSVDWNWPVQIGFLHTLTDSSTLDEFKSHHYLQKLAHGYKISKVRRTANILVLNGSLKQISKSLETNSFSIKTDLLVLFMEPDSNMPRYYKQTITRLQNISYNSFFLTVIPKDRTPFYWLEGLIFHLSHNTKIDEAIKRIDWPGKLVTSKEIIRKSRVDQVLDKMLDKIAGSAHLNNYKFDKVLSTNVRARIDNHSKIRTRSTGVSPNEIVTEIKIKKETFEYQHESDESSIIKEIAVRHSENVSDMIDKAGISIPDKKKAEQSGARYLQVVFQDQNKEPAHHALVINRPYSLTVKIGIPDEGFMQAGQVSKEDVKIKKGSEERVDILLRYRDTLDQQFIMLPHTGSSTEAVFDINIAEEGETHFEIFAFHKNRLFQQIDLSVFLCVHEVALGDVPGIKMEMINMPRTTLSDFDLKKKYGLSLVFTEGYPVIAQESIIREIRDEEHINKFNEQLTEIIEKYVTSKNPNSENLIFALAEQGALIFKNLFGDKELFNQPIQIISSSAKHFPLEFLYIEKLHRKAEKLCPNAAAALEKGSCAGCNEGADKYICPFGFAALRTVIERHRIGENVDLIKPEAVGLKTDISMNRPAIPILANTLFGTSEQVDKSQVGLRKRLGQKIKKCSGKATEATDWDKWSKAIENKKPDTLVIVGHVEPSKRGGSNQLEIGTDLLRQAVIDEEFVYSPDAKSHPFLILIGCNTQDVELSFLDFASHFKKCGAAIVLSTFTKIRGSHAVPLVEQLLDILHEKKGNEIHFGEAILELRQKLFAKGLYVSMAMVAHGDADWKLKI